MLRAPTCADDVSGSIPGDDVSPPIIRDVRDLASLTRTASLIYDLPNIRALMS